jgi:hypothetical protein
LARKAGARPARSSRLAVLRRGALLILLAGGLGVVGYQAIRFIRTCATIEGAREAIEIHVQNRYVRRLARVLKTADRQTLEAGMAVRVTALSCGPSLLGDMTCRARYTLNGHNVGMAPIEHYFRISFSLLAGWRVASVTETSGLRYSLAPCRCSLSADGR